MDEDAIAGRLRRMGLVATADELGRLAVEAERVAAASDLLRARSGQEDEGDRFAAILAQAAGRMEPAAWEDTEPAMPSSASAVDAAVARAVEFQPRLNAFIEIFGDAARSRARHVEQSCRRPIHTLHLVPFAHKDVFVARRRVPTAGVSGKRWPGPISRSLARLERAGAVSIGATNLDPYCYAATGLNRFFGRTKHPTDARYAVGGSSSGSAVAVAAGIVPFALGTDTGGSVRIPASLCGVYGLKPTHGLVADPGVYPLSSSQDAVGILAACPAMLGRVLTVVSGRRRARAERPPPTDPWIGLQVGIDPLGLCADLDPDVAAALQRVLEAASARGAVVREVPFPPLDELNAAASIVTGWEALSVHRLDLTERSDRYPRLVRMRLLSAALIEREAYDAARQNRGCQLDAVLTATFAEADILVCPTIRTLTSRVDHLDEDDADKAGSLSAEHLRLNRPFSYLGLPAISVPAGLDRNGLPIGIQFVGRPYADAQLVELVQAFPSFAAFDLS